MATPLLGAEGLHLEYPTRVVFDSLSVGIEEGARIGIVGRNGDGKSSLPDIAAGPVEPMADRGTLRGDAWLRELDQSDRVDLAIAVRTLIAGDDSEPAKTALQQTKQNRSAR